MNVNMKEYFHSWEKIREGLDGCKEPELMLPLICTALDYVAESNDISTLELIETIKPAIEFANKTLGRMGK